jgi:hypothetical protein
MRDGWGAGDVAEVRAVRDAARVDVAVDLVGGAGHAVPGQDRVAGPHAQEAEQVDADVGPTSGTMENTVRRSLPMLVIDVSTSAEETWVPAGPAGLSRPRRDLGDEECAGTFGHVTLASS